MLNAAIYYQAANGPYILDDFPNLVNNNKVLIHHLDYQSLKSALTSSNSSRFYRPLSMLTFAVDYYIAGNKSPYSVKVTNIFIHCVIALGIYLLSVLLLSVPGSKSPATYRAGGKWAGLITASIWLFQPLFVSTVLYSVQRMAMLSTLFVIYGCIAYCILRERIINQGKGRLALLFSTISFTTLGFLCKENAVLLPGFLLLIEYYAFNNGIYRGANPYFSATLKLLFCIPVATVLVYLAYSYVHNASVDLANYSFNINERILTEPRVLWHYLGWLTFLNPEPLGIYHDDIRVSTGLLQPATTLISIIAWIALVIASLRLKRVSWVLPFSVLWFLWGQSLESTTLPLSLVFEHRNYLPGYGPIFALSFLIYRFVSSGKTSGFLSMAVISITVAAPVILTAGRVANWEDTRSLALSQLKQHPRSGYALARAANYLQETGDIDNALVAIDQARHLYPGNNYFLFDKILMLCQSRPGQRFNKTLIGDIRTLSEKEVIPAYVVPYKRLIDTCTGSLINRDVLMVLYNKYRGSHNTYMASLSYYGMGRIYLSRNNYADALDAFMESEKANPAANLTPEIRKLQALLRNGNQPSGQPE